MRLPQIIGVAGTNGAGKDTLARIRSELQHSDNVSMSDILRRELDKRGLSHERENMRAVGNEWRAEFGPGVLALKAIEDYQLSGKTSGVTMGSVRSIGEVEDIKAAGGVLVWVDADPRIRYDRILARQQGRPTDQKTFEEFVTEERDEMYPPEGEEANKAIPNMAAVKAMADIVVINEFPTEKAFEEYLKTEFELGSN